MSTTGSRPVVDICPKIEDLTASFVLDPKLDGEEWSFFDD